MKLPLPTIYITLLLVIGLLKQIPSHNLMYALKHWFVQPLSVDFDLHNFLNEHSAYYRMLCDEDQSLFQKRVLKFIILKRFIPKNGVQKVSDEMKALIASKAVQVTFGYPYIYLSYLKKIFIYPEKYKSETDYYYHGETSMDGHIKFSWANFIQGEYEQSDGISLGLHEFTHALHIENHIRNDYYLFINPIYLVSLRKAFLVLKDEIATMETPIRQYGITSFPEFFAVCVEVYFEKPDELKKYNPDLYKILSLILNQDILEYQSRESA